MTNESVKVVEKIKEVEKIVTNKEVQFVEKVVERPVFNEKIVTEDKVD